MFNLERLERIILSVFLFIILAAGVLILFLKTCTSPSFAIYHPPRMQEKSFTSHEEPSRRRVNINTAPAKDLMRLKGVGSAIAGRIIEYRTQSGLFLSASDILKVKGVGKGIYEKNKDTIVVD